MKNDTVAKTDISLFRVCSLYIAARFERTHRRYPAMKRDNPQRTHVRLGFDKFHANINRIYDRAHRA